LDDGRKKLVSGKKSTVRKKEEKRGVFSPPGEKKGSADHRVGKVVGGRTSGRRREKKE